MTKELLRYYRQIGKELDCPKSMRDQFLADAKRMTDDFLAENPGTTLDELKRAIGEPDQLAEMFLESADHSVVAGYRKRKNGIKRLAVILLAVALFATTTLAIYVFKMKQDAVITAEYTLTIYRTSDSIGNEASKNNNDSVDYINANKPNVTEISSGEINSKTGLNTSWKLNQSNGKYVNLYIENKGSDPVVATINDQNERTFEAGEKGYIYLEVTQGFLGLDREYAFKVEPGANGGTADIHYEIAQDLCYYSEDGKIDGEVK